MNIMLRECKNPVRIPLFLSEVEVETGSKTTAIHSIGKGQCIVVLRLSFRCVEDVGDDGLCSTRTVDEIDLALRHRLGCSHINYGSRSTAPSPEVLPGKCGCLCYRDIPDE